MEKNSKEQSLLLHHEANVLVGTCIYKWSVSFCFSSAAPPPPSHLRYYQIVVVGADRAYLAEVLIPVRKLDEIQLSSTQCLMTIRHRYTT